MSILGKLKVNDIMALKVGDIIQNTSCGDRRILTVRDSGYDWEYVGVPGKVFLSENSNDPFFVWNWYIKEA